MMMSMTGYASLQRETPGGMLVIELRSVNHRYLELIIKLDDELRNLEPQIREKLSQSIGRGKVECRISLMRLAQTARSTVLNQPALEQLATLNSALKKQFPDSASLSVTDILKWPGVLDDVKKFDDEALGAILRSAMQEILGEFNAMRAREGEKLKVAILERLHQVEALVCEVKPVLGVVVKEYQQKLTDKLKEVMATYDEDRIRQEITLFAQRIDVDEELTRLTSHVEEVRRILNQEQLAGKRLDFLMQELNREANTLGSKSVSSETSKVSMELKVLIEQMREQIQNIA
jgi:uncharacterized protein (TIGR00255 family)